VPISDDDLERLGRRVELGSILVAADGPAPQFTDTMKARYQAKFRA
jgi:hypothetical protein